MRCSAASMPVVEAPAFAAARLIELHQRLHVGRRRRTAEGVLARASETMRARAGGFLRAARRRAWQTKILRRLAVSVAPLASYGPSIVTWPTCG